MARIGSISDIAAKWASITPMHSGDYEDGVKNPRRPWAATTAAAEASWATGVAQAAADKRFGAGVRRAGDEKWSRKTLTTGVRNWGPGVAGAESDYAAGFGPYVDAIASCSLPPRYPRQDPRNLNRVKAIVDCLIAKYKSRGRG